MDDSFARVIDSLPDPSFAVDADGRVAAWNPAISELTGVSPGSMVGEGSRAYAIPFYGERTPMLVDAVLARDDAWANRYEAVAWRNGTISAEAIAPMLNSRKGAHLWFSAGPLRTADGGLAGAVETIRDISEHRRRLGERDLLRLAVDRLPGGLLLTDPFGTILYANEALASLSGIPVEELVGTSWSVFASERCKTLPPEAAEAIKAGRAWSNECWARDGDDSSACTEWRLSPLCDSTDGETIGYVATARDCSEEHKLEARLLQAGKMEAIGRLASNIAHDFNNLPAAIRGYSDLVAGSMGSSDPRRYDLAQITRAADKAGEMTRQLLAFGRSQVLVPRVVDLAQTVHDVTPMIRRLLGVDVVVSIRSQRRLWSCLADPAQLESVIVNLAVNARDAMPQGGQLTTDLGNVALDSGFVSEHPGSSVGQYVRLSVTDTGVGMDEQTLSRALEPFFTTKAPGSGTGLGLASAYGIVKQSGGFMYLDSQVGQGTRCTVYLPAVREGGDLGQDGLAAGRA